VPPLAVEPSVTDTACQGLAEQEEASTVRKAVAQLLPKQREAIQLANCEEMGASEAAKANCNESAFRRRLADGFARLQQRIRANIRGWESWNLEEAPRKNLFHSTYDAGKISSFSISQKRPNRHQR
jgi:hypothetical protein